MYLSIRAVKPQCLLPPLKSLIIPIISIVVDGDVALLQFYYKVDILSRKKIMVFISKVLSTGPS